MTYDWQKSFPDGTSISLFEPIDLRPSYARNRKSGKRYQTFPGVVQVTFRGPIKDGKFFIRRFDFHRNWKIVELPQTFFAKLLDGVRYEYVPDVELDGEHIRRAVAQMKREYEISLRERLPGESVEETENRLRRKA